MAEEAELELRQSEPTTTADFALAAGLETELVGRRALRKASWRLLPLIGLGYGVAYMDRTNISFASLQMNQDLRFSATVYGLGAGLFFIAYALMEMPSNLMLMRFGARRWIARIMLTWGVLAVGMMFVRTPMQFYVMRFLLGAAEAGFFPGVVFYLMQWFPAHERGRAISRFYVSLPLSTVVMGGLAGTLMGLHRFALSGWQWLFLAEGLPAVLLSAVIFLMLPDGPADANWLTPGERDWIVRRLAADQTMPGAVADHGVLRALKDPRVWGLGLCALCVQAAGYALTFSAPALLQGVTHMDVTHVGFLVATVAFAGAGAMLVAGWHSDHRGERHLHLTSFLLVTGGAVLALGLSNQSWITVSAYAVAMLAFYAVQAVLFLIPSDVLRGRAAAGGVAAVGSISMVGGFIGPYAWGLVRDATGSFQAGLLCLAVPYLIAAAGVLLIRHHGRTRAFLVAPAVQPLGV